MQGGNIKRSEAGRRLTYGVVGIGVCCAAAGGPAIAADVRFIPRLEVVETYTDNVRLSETNREDDFVTIGTVGGNLTAESRKLNLSLDYTGKYLIFTRSDEEDFRNSGRAVLTFDVIEDYLSIRADGIVDQRFVNRGSAITFSDATLSEDLRTVQSYSVQPELTNRFGTLGVFEAVYRASYTDSSGTVGEQGVITESFLQDARVSFTSGERFGRLQWQIFGTLRKDDRQNQNTSDREEKLAGLDLSYAVRRGVFVEGSVAYGDTNFTNVVRDSETIVWNAGFRLQPNRRLELSARYGQRFRNDVLTASLEWQASNRTQVSVSWNDRLTTSQFILSNIGGGFDPTQPFPPDTGLDPTLPGFTLTDSGFRQQRLNASLIHTTRRWSASLTGFFEERRFERNELNRAKAFGGQINYSYELDRNTSLLLNGLYRQDEFTDTARNDDSIIASLTLEHTLSSYITGSLSVSRAEQISAVPTFDAHENSVRLLLRGTF